MKQPKPNFYNLAWRWHFYAGLFVAPFMVMLALTGIIYLFKPQLDSLMYSSLLNVPAGHHTVPADELLQRVMSVDMLITDHCLPDGSGLCAIEMARARHGHLPALVITGDTAAAHLQTLLNVGVPVLHKPFQTDGLLRVIQLQFSVGEAAGTSPRYSSA